MTQINKTQAEGEFKTGLRGQTENNKLTTHGYVMLYVSSDAVYYSEVLEIPCGRYFSNVLFPLFPFFVLNAVNLNQCVIVVMSFVLCVDDEVYRL